MSAHKMIVGGLTVAALAFSAGPALALAWDWPYPWADPKEAAQDRGAGHGENYATEGGSYGLKSTATREELEENRSHTAADKHALKGDRNDLANNRSELNRDRRD
jgi:hypothetical protein